MKVYIITINREKQKLTITEKSENGKKYTIIEIGSTSIQRNSIDEQELDTRINLTINEELKKQSSNLSDEHIFYFNNKKRINHAELIVEDNKFVLKKGAEIYPKITSHKIRIQRLREQYKHLIKNNKTTQDIIFEKHPSVPGYFISGGSCDGRVKRIDKNGITLGEYCKRQPPSRKKGSKNNKQKKLL